MNAERIVEHFASLREAFAELAGVVHSERLPHQQGRPFSEADLSMIERAIERVEAIPHAKTRIDFERSMDLDIRELLAHPDLTKRISPSLWKACDSLKRYAQNIDVCIERFVYDQFHQAALTSNAEEIDDLMRAGYSIDLKSPQSEKTLVETLANGINSLGDQFKALLPRHRTGLRIVLDAGATVTETVVSPAKDPEARAMLEAAWLRQAGRAIEPASARIGRRAGL